MKALTVLLVALLAGCAASPTRVTANASSQDAATRRALNAAVLHDHGATVISDAREVDGAYHESVRQYSAGRVKDFRVVSSTPHNVTMDVWTQPSAIAGSVLNPAGHVSVHRTPYEYEQYLHERNSGDALLEKVLQDYPRAAIVVKLGKTSARVDEDSRALVITAPITFSWNQKWLAGFVEALDTTHDANGSERVVIQNRIFNDTYRFDEKRYAAIKHGLLHDPYGGIYIAFDVDGIRKTCVPLVQFMDKSLKIFPTFSRTIPFGLLIDKQLVINSTVQFTGPSNRVTAYAVGHC